MRRSGVIWADRAVRRAVGYRNQLKKSSLGPPDKREVGSSTLPRPIDPTARVVMG